MERIRVLNESKFKRLTEAEMAKVNGGLCVSCKKRDRKIEFGISAKASGTINTDNYSGKYEVTGTLTFSRALESNESSTELAAISIPG
ncbi:MAG: bacteriocin [Bacteroidales bacterium]|nr:bacteriocin [Bacteroidales bacterium]